MSGGLLPRPRPKGTPVPAAPLGFARPVPRPKPPTSAVGALKEAAATPISAAAAEDADWDSWLE